MIFSLNKKLFSIIKSKISTNMGFLLPPRNAPLLNIKNSMNSNFFNYTFEKDFNEKTKQEINIECDSTKRKRKRKMKKQ
jgi:hypothetical protein